MMACTVHDAWKRFQVLLLVAFSFCLTGKAQENYKFRHLSTADGLSQSSVIAIAQDKLGLLWFGTRDGLNLYDGNQFTVYRHDPQDSTSLSNNDILEILVDTEGNLWIGTYNGLNKYNYSEDRFYRYVNDKGNQNSLANNSVWAIEQLDNGEIWVGTGGGICIFKDGQFQRIQHDPEDPFSLSGNYILEIYQDSAGDIWVGTSKGLNKVTSRNGADITFARFQNNPANPASLNDNFVQAITEGTKGELWIGTRGGLHQLTKSSGEFTLFEHKPQDPSSISHDDVRSLSYDDNGDLWIGTYNGLNKMTGAGTFTRLLNDLNNPQSLSKNTIKSTFIDRKGSLWVGAYYGGINMLDETNANFRNYKESHAENGLSYNVVSSIVEDQQGKIYIGTEGGGIDLLNPQTEEISYIKKGSRSGLTSNNIKSLYLAGKNLWVGTFNTGIDVYDTKAKKFIAHYDKGSSLSHNSVYALLKEDDSLYWVGTFGGGLNLFNAKSKTSQVFLHDPASASSLSDNQVRLLLKDAVGNLWVGTQYGLNLLRKEDLDRQHYVFERFFYSEEKKSGEDILVIFQDNQKRLWVGTYESGLSLYDDVANQFVGYPVFDPSDGSSNVIHGILEDEAGDLWISSNQGITRFDPEDGSTLTFDESDGLVSNEFNNNAAYKSSAGIMYFGGPDGLSAFSPKQIKTNEYAPKTIITDLKVFNEPVRAGESDGILKRSITETNEIVLEHDQAIFSLSFAIPNFINPDKNLYKYRLAGLEENWNVTHKNTATYTIQRPGTYTFEVIGANNDEVWSDTTTSLTVRVLPAPWRTWWAFTIYFVLISLALYLLTNIIQSRSRLRHELELEHLENERQQAVNKMKLQFFTNISHEFRTPLTLILGPLEQIIQEYKGSNKMYKQLLVIEKNAVRMLKLINQLMDFRKFENKHERLQAAQGNIVRFVEEIFLSFKHYAKLHNIDYQFEKVDESICVWYDRDKMERVFYNLISNAFKFTDPEGSIRVSVQKKDDQVEFTVTDTGIGMEKDHLEKIFDRFYEVEDASTKEKHKRQRGTGIGLAIAKQVVEIHAGIIKAESEKGSGTTFTVTLPLGKEHLSEDQIITDFKDSEDVTSYLKHNPEIEFPDQKKLSEPIAVANEDAPLILIVEDNASVRQFMVDIFKDTYRIEEAEDGMIGFKKAVQLVPDLIISDVMMPKMDGIELCMHTKSNLKTSHIPFVLLTARTSLIFKFEGLESGADEYINKPFNIKELQLKVKNLLNIYARMREKFADQSIVRPSEITVSSMDEKLLKRALEIVDENIGNEFFNIQMFSSELGVSRTMLFTKIKAWTNLTPNEFIHSMRMKRAAQLLEQNKITVSQVSYQVGFQNPKYFSKCFQKYHSATPTEYAEKFTVNPVEN